MAGFFGLFNYEKEGPGISKNAPKKKAFFVFFETFFRNFWKFVPINIVYNIISLPLITSGLAAAGITNVTRNIARDKHSFGLSDFFETIKKNWKQAIIFGIINTLVYITLLFDLYFFNSLSGNKAIIFLGIVFFLLLIYSFMNFFIWTLMITFNFSVKNLFKNSFKFAFINLKKNFLCLISLALVYGIFIGIAVLLSKYLIMVLVIELMIYFIFFPSFKYLLIQFCVFDSVKKYIIDPYYKEHPGEDIEKRRNLGLEIEEEQTPEITEGEDASEQEDGENIFTD